MKLQLKLDGAVSEQTVGLTSDEKFRNWNCVCMKCELQNKEQKYIIFKNNWIYISFSTEI